MDYNLFYHVHQNFTMPLIFKFLVENIFGWDTLFWSLEVLSKIGALLELFDVFLLTWTQMSVIMAFITVYYELFSFTISWEGHKFLYKCLKLHYEWQKAIPTTWALLVQNSFAKNCCQKLCPQITTRMLIPTTNKDENNRQSHDCICALWQSQMSQILKLSIYRTSHYP